MSSELDQIKETVLSDENKQKLRYAQEDALRWTIVQGSELIKAIGGFIKQMVMQLLGK